MSGVTVPIKNGRSDRVVPAIVVFSEGSHNFYPNRASCLLLAVEGASENRISPTGSKTPFSRSVDAATHHICAKSASLMDHSVPRSWEGLPAHRLDRVTRPQAY